MRYHESVVHEEPNQLVAITTDAVERILREKLDAEKDRRLVDSVLDELERDQSAA